MSLPYRGAVITRGGNSLPAKSTTTLARPTRDPTGPQRQARFSERKGRGQICATVTVGPVEISALGLEAGVSDRQAVAQAIEVGLRDGLIRTQPKVCAEITRATERKLEMANGG